MGRVCPFMSGPIQLIEDGQWTGSTLFQVNCIETECMAWGDICGPVQQPVHGCRLIEREFSTMSR